MTATEMNAELFHELSIIAEDETMMAKLLKYAKKLTTRKNDPTLLTKEEFFQRVEEAEAQYARGEYSEMLTGDDLATHLKRQDYDI